MSMEPAGPSPLRVFIGHLCWWVGLLVMVLSGGCTLVFIGMDPTTTLIAMLFAAPFFLPALGLFFLGRWLRDG